MLIAIIGAGNVGQSLATGWLRAGHQIVFGLAEPSDARRESLAAKVPGATLADNAQAARDADAIVLAVPWDAVPAALAALGDLDGRIVVDATNPLTFGADGLALALGFDDSGGETVARLAPGARVFKAMNQVGSAVMSATDGYPVAPTMFVAGDDPDGKTIVLGLVADLGFDAVDAGLLRQARLLEPYAMLWIDRVMNGGAAPTNAFAFMRKEDGQ